MRDSTEGLAVWKPGPALPGSRRARSASALLPACAAPLRQQQLRGGRRKGGSEHPHGSRAPEPRDLGDSIGAESSRLAPPASTFTLRSEACWWAQGHFPVRGLFTVGTFRADFLMTVLLAAAVVTAGSIYGAPPSLHCSRGLPHMNTLGLPMPQKA